MEELFKKVYIKTEADLPKEEDEYFVNWSDSICVVKNKFDVWDFRPNHSPDISIWMAKVDWYLIEQPSDPVSGDQSMYDKIEEFVSIYMMKVGNVEKKEIIEHDLREGISMGLVIASQSQSKPEPGKTKEEILKSRNIELDRLQQEKPMLVYNILEAMEEYASQFKSDQRQVEITDEEIEKWAKKKYPDRPVYQPALRNAVIDSLKAMRSGLIKGK